MTAQWPRILMPLLIYEVTITMVKELEKNINQFLWKLLGLPRSLSSIALYCQFTKLHFHWAIGRADSSVLEDCK